MKIPNLLQTLFQMDEITGFRQILTVEDFLQVPETFPVEDAAGIFDPHRVIIRCPLAQRNLSQFDALLLTVRSESQGLLLVGMRLLHGSDQENVELPEVSFSGGREHLLAGDWKTIVFPRECFGFYGLHKGWENVRAIELTFGRDRITEDTGDVRVLIKSVVACSRTVPEGPRLTRAGLKHVFHGPTVARGQISPLEELSLTVPPPHSYPVESPEELLTGRIMGQRLGYPIPWDANPLGVHEWSHFLHRHHFLREFVVGFIGTGNHRYVEAVHDIISSWIKANPVPLESNGGAGPSWETLSTAWRLREWLWVVRVMWQNDVFLPDFRETMLCSIWEHATHLMEHRGHSNNWIIVESGALVLAGLCFPGFSDAGTWVKTGLARLQGEVARQFFPDGAHFEISPLYHAICLHALLDVHLAAEAAGIEIPVELTRKLEPLTEYLAALCRPNFSWPAINDSGSIDTDYTPLLTLCGEVLDRPDFRWIGSRGQREYPPQKRVQIFPEAGIAIMRDRWESDGNMLVFRGGCAGAAHVHNDVLSLDVTVFGLPMLVDPGITSYAPDRLTQWYRSAQAHNMILIDGKAPEREGLPFRERVTPPEHGDWYSEQTIPGSDSYAADPPVVPSATQGVIDIVSGICRGPWRQLEGDFVWKRVVAFVRCSYWLIADTIMGSGQHEITTCWQFAPGRVDIDLDTFAVHAVDARGPRLEIRPLFSELKPDIELFGGLTSPLRGWVSVGGRDLPALSCRYRVITELPVTLLWLLLPYPSMPSSRPEAILRREAPSALGVAVVWDKGTKDYIDVNTLLRGTVSRLSIIHPIREK